MRRSSSTKGRRLGAVCRRFVRSAGRVHERRRGVHARRLQDRRQVSQRRELGRRRRCVGARQGEARRGPPGALLERLQRTVAQIPIVGSGHALWRREGRRGKAGGVERQPIAAPRALLDRVAEHGDRAARRRQDVPTRAGHHAADGHRQADRRQERAVHQRAAHASSRRSIRRRTRRARGRAGGEPGGEQRDGRAHRGAADRGRLQHRPAGPGAFGRAESDGSADRVRRAAAQELRRRRDQSCARARSAAQSRATLAEVPVQSRRDRQQASLAEVTALLRPNTGSLWKFYNDALAGALPKQGTHTCRSRTAASSSPRAS